MTYIDNSISILDTRFPQPGRYKDYGVPDAVADQADALFRERNVCQNERVKEIDAELRRLLGNYIRDYIYPRGMFRGLQWVGPYIEDNPDALEAYKVLQAASAIEPEEKIFIRGAALDALNIASVKLAPKHNPEMARSHQQSRSADKWWVE